MLVYLAGPINDCSDAECKDWRAVATAGLGFNNVLDPMRNDYRGRELEPTITQTIVEQDKADIQRCTALIAYVDKPSVGTSMEILHAWQLGRAVYVVNLTGKPPSPWLRYHSRAICDSLETAIRVCNDHHWRLECASNYM